MSLNPDQLPPGPRKVFEPFFRRSRGWRRGWPCLLGFCLHLFQLLLHRRIDRGLLGASVEVARKAPSEHTDRDDRDATDDEQLLALFSFHVSLTECRGRGCRRGCSNSVGEITQHYQRGRVLIAIDGADEQGTRDEGHLKVANELITHAAREKQRFDKLKPQATNGVKYKRFEQAWADIPDATRDDPFNKALTTSLAPLYPHQHIGAQQHDLPAHAFGLRLWVGNGLDTNARAKATMASCTSIRQVTSKVSTAWLRCGRPSGHAMCFADDLRHDGAGGANPRRHPPSYESAY